MSVRTVSVSRQGIGANQALYAIRVRAQIDGHLSTVDFVEGQDLCKGEALARVDPVVYQAQYNQAVAKKAQGEGDACIEQSGIPPRSGLSDATIVHREAAPPVSLDRRETSGDPPLAVLCRCF
jgi:multidrug efflux pump subunit AcrA (membrane-fusion protein)